jgi:hypothetical protein
MDERSWPLAFIDFEDFCTKMIEKGCIMERREPTKTQPKKIHQNHNLFSTVAEFCLKRHLSYEFRCRWSLE